jgi:predicted ABC-type ATPase
MLCLPRHARNPESSGRRSNSVIVFRVSEIVLVVNGDLIALQISSWNEKRMEQQQIHAYAAKTFIG